MLKKIHSLSPHQKYLRRIRQRQHFILLLRLVCLCSFFLLWEMGAINGVLNAFIFSSPSRIFETLRQFYEDGSLFCHIGATLAETFFSFILVMLLGLAFAILFWRFRILYQVLEPFLILMNSLPKSALAPVLIVWLGNEPRTIIVTAVSLAVFGCIMTIYSAFVHTDPEKIKLIQTLNGNRRHILTKVLLPASIPILINTMKVNIGLCLVGVIIGEFLAAREGLGYLIIYGSQTFKMNYVMTAIMILCLFAVLLYFLIGVLDSCYHRIYLGGKDISH